ncbi:MAG: outer membrane homotrimeric porin [Pseudodesulfovibrio sp.]
MKRLIMLAVLCAFVLGASVASAADIKASGTWAVEALWKSNWDMLDKADTDRGTNKSFGIYQRATTTFQFIANENLKGVMQLRYGTQEWGQKSFAVGAGDAATNTASENRMTVRQAYLDFNWPDTTVNVKAGFMSVGLPAAFGGGSYILDEEIAAALVGGQISDNVSYLVGFARAASGQAAAGAATANINVDAYVAALPMNFEGFTFAPFGAYAPISNGVTAATVAVNTNLGGLASLNATTNTTGADFDNAYWLGAAFTMDLFDPFVLKADVNYGAVDSKQSMNKRSGWLFDAALEYKGMDFMTPELFFAYTTGEDGNSTKGDGSSERMPVLAASNWAMGSFFFGGDRLLMGSKGNRDDYLGFWALGLSLKDIQSFADGLTHDAHFIYAAGTNDKDTYTSADTGYNFSYGNSLTEKDTLVEVDFNTGYKLYDELTLSLDLGYFNLSTKESRWEDTKGWKGGDAWKISSGVVYKF